MKLDSRLNSSQQISVDSFRKGKKNEHMLLDSCIGHKEILSRHKCSWQIKTVISIDAIYGGKWRNRTASDWHKWCRDNLGSDETHSHGCITAEHATIKVISIPSWGSVFFCLFSPFNVWLNITKLKDLKVFICIDSNISLIFKSQIHATIWLDSSLFPCSCFLTGPRLPPGAGREGAEALWPAH